MSGEPLGPSNSPSNSPSNPPPARPAEPPAARSPRFGRGARWGIGLGVAAGFAIAAFVLFVVALTGLDWSSFDELDGSATATVVALDESGASGLAVDLSFRSDGDRYVATVTWPDDRAAPKVGDKVAVVFDTFDPENSVELDDGQGDGGDDGFEAGYQGAPRDGQQTVVPAAVRAAFPVATLAATEGTDDSSGNRHAWAWWASLGCGLASLLSVIATAIWASRVPPKPPVHVGYYGQPGFGGYPPYPGQFQPGPYRPMPYPPQQYPPQQYPPQQYPPQQYPPQPGQPQQYPPDSSPPPAPGPGGYPPPS